MHGGTEKKPAVMETTGGSEILMPAEYYDLKELADKHAARPAS